MLNLTPHQNLLQFTFPSINSTALQPWSKAGLAKEASKPGFSIRLSWGTKQVNAFLRLHFPVLFSHFDATTTGFQDIPDEPDSTGLKRLNYQLPYTLIKKNRKNYSLVDKTHPTAEAYVESMSSGMAKGVGFKAKTLYLGEPFHLYTRFQGTNRSTESPRNVSHRRSLTSGLLHPPLP